MKTIIKKCSKQQQGNAVLSVFLEKHVGQETTWVVKVVTNTNGMGGYREWVLVDVEYDHEDVARARYQKMVGAFDVMYNDVLDDSMDVDDSRLWTVWVGGVEVVDHKVSLSEAERIAAHYTEQGYEDVVYVRSEVPLMLYNLLVNGEVVNETYLTRQEAVELSKKYKAEGYTDIEVEPLGEDK